MAKRTSHLTKLDQISVEERKLERKIKIWKRERRRRKREKVHLLSRFDGDRTVSILQSKRQSSSTRRGLHIETKIWHFRQAPRGRIFSPTWVNSCLTAIQMVELFGVGMAVHFSSKDLGLNAGLLGLFLDSPKPKFWDCFQIVRSWIMRLIFGLSMCIVLCVLLKVNNMCLCENHVNYIVEKYNCS